MSFGVLESCVLRVYGKNALYPAYRVRGAAFTAGVYGLPGSGGFSSNVEVVGGRLERGSSQGPIMRRAQRRSARGLRSSRCGASTATSPLASSPARRR